MARHSDQARLLLHSAIPSCNRGDHQRSDRAVGHEALQKYDLPIETPSWSLKRAKEDVRQSDGRFLRIGVRPFDTRWTYYTGRTNGFQARPRALSTENMREGNVALVAKRQTKELQFSSIWVVDGPINEGFFSINQRGRETLFPAFKLPDPGSFLFHGPGRLSNLVAKKSCEAVEQAEPEPHVLLAYVYAILHSQAFRQRYAEMLAPPFTLFLTRFVHTNLMIRASL